MDNIVAAVMAATRRGRDGHRVSWRGASRAAMSVGLLCVTAACGDAASFDDDWSEVADPLGEGPSGKIEKSAAQTGVGGYNVWTSNQQLDLEYCINDNPSLTIDPFPSTGPYSHANAVAAMAQATADWQRVANVRFEYHPERNGSQCDANDTIPGGGSPSSFKVIHVDTSLLDNACAFRPQGGGECRGVRTLVFNADGDHPFGMTRTFRHELGHILGLAHEYARLDNPVDPDPSETACAQTASADPLTEYDVNSIMQSGEGFCGGEPLEHITVLDGQGLRRLYGAPASWLAAYGAPLLGS